MVAATDSRHMQPIADQVYRFSPVRAREEDLARFHGTNERVSLSNYAEMIAFYHRLITVASQSAQADSQAR
jgi:carboxypeptidase PM20D1